MKRIIIILIFFCAVFTSIAQEGTSDWEVVLFAPYPEPIIYIMAAQSFVDSIFLPDKLPPFSQVSISPDREYLLLQISQRERIIGANLLNLQTGEYRELLNASISSNFYSYEAFAFSPDARHIVATYAYWEENANEYSQPIYGAELIVDIDTGVIELQSEGSAVFAAWSNDAVPSTRFISTTEGDTPIPFLEIQGTVRLPNQEERLTRTMVLTPYGGIHDSGETLINGEHIVSSFAASLDMNGAETSMYFPIVRYETDELSYPVWVDMSICDTSGYLCYALDHNFTAHWVMDGQYIYMHPNIFGQNPSYNEFQLLARDGTLSNFQLEGQMYQFIAGTPDGWLMHYIGDNQSILHFSIVDGELIQTTLLELPNRTELIYLVEKPFLGVSLENPQVFPEVPIPRGQG